jgi:hypothetical protein
MPPEGKLPLPSLTVSTSISGSLCVGSSPYAFTKVMICVADEMAPRIIIRAKQYESEKCMYGLFGKELLPP